MSSKKFIFTVLSCCYHFNIPSLDSGLSSGPQAVFAVRVFFSFFFLRFGSFSICLDVLCCDFRQYMLWTWLAWIECTCNRRCCCNEMPPKAGQNVDYFYASFIQEISKVVLKKILSCNACPWHLGQSSSRYIRMCFCYKFVHFIQQTLVALLISFSWVNFPTCT